MRLIAAPHAVAANMQQFCNPENKEELSRTTEA